MESDVIATRLRPSFVDTFSGVVRENHAHHDPCLSDQVSRAITFGIGHPTRKVHLKLPVSGRPVNVFQTTVMVCSPGVHSVMVG